MDEGWALRFAHAIFQRFDVLFVGYRLEDPPLRYLSLALEGTSEQERWALIADQGLDSLKKADVERDWERRHVKPIWYPAKNGDFRALERTMDAWGKDNSRSFLDRRSVLADIGKSNPKHLKPHELNRAKFFLQESPSLRDFAKSSLDMEWFDTLFAWGCFDFLLKNIGDWSEADRFLVERFVDWMLANPVEILGKITDHRGTIHSAVLDQFCRRYQEGGTAVIDTATLRCILEFFRPVIEQTASVVLISIFIKRILSDLIDAGYEDDAFWLLSIALRTKSVITTGINFAFQSAKLEGKATEEISEYELQYELRFENHVAEHNVKDLFEQVFIPRVGSVGFKFVHYLTLKFLELRSIHSRGNRRDLGSQYYRAAIEAHPQNFDNDPVNFLLDLLRDSWEELLKVNREQAETIYSFWQPLQDKLIERLRIHALTKLVEALDGVMPINNVGASISAAGANIHASVLFYDFLLSRPGMEIMKARHRIPTRPDVTVPYLKSYKLLPFDAAAVENFNRYVAQFRARGCRVRLA